MPHPGPTTMLALESSCDECSAAVVERAPARTGAARVAVRSNVIFSQIDLHRRFGGVVPEVASRNHLEMIGPVIDEALEKAGVGFADLDAVAVTQRPGLIGALLVGVSTAKAIAYALGKPLVGVNHLDGHLHSIFIDEQPGCAALEKLEAPLLACLVSGGHTQLQLIKALPPRALELEKLGESRDDAAGEAFDKCAKLLGLPYPGGVHLEKAAKGGNRDAFDFPRALPGRENLEFSFSGLKTAVATRIRALGFEPQGVGAAWGVQRDESKQPSGQLLADLCASTQEAIVQTLVRKIKIALRQTGARGLAVVGGVSANARLRELLDAEIKVPILVPNREYCTDNAAMIGAAGLFMLDRSETLTGEPLLSANAYSSSI